MLRKCIGTPDQQVTPLHLVDSIATLILQPHAVLDTHKIICSDHPVEQCLVQWHGLPITAANWEDTTSLLQRFPDLHLADKVNVNGGGSNVMNRNRSNGPINSSGVPTSEPRAIEDEMGLQLPTEPRSVRIRKEPTKYDDFVMDAGPTEL